MVICWIMCDDVGHSMVEVKNLRNCLCLSLNLYIEHATNLLSIFCLFFFLLAMDRQFSRSNNLCTF